MKVELTDLKERVEEALATSPLRKSVGSFELDEGRDDDGMEFIRVIFDINASSTIPDKELANFADYIESALAQMDERFASVRFSDAA
jgi:hypothetical protein